MADYFGLLKESWDRLWKNPVLFLPYVFIIIASLIYIGILVLMLMPFFTGIKDAGEILSVLKGSLASIILLSLIFLLVLHMFSTMLYGMVRDVVVNGRSSLKNGWGHVKRLYFRFLGLQAVKFIAILIIAGFIIIPFISLKFYGGGIKGLVLSVLIFFILLILYLLGFLFAEAVLFIDGKGVFQSIGSSFSLARNRIRLVVISLSIVVLVGLIASVVSLLFNIIPILGALVNVFVRIIMSLVITLFIYSVYVNRKKLK